MHKRQVQIAQALLGLSSPQAGMSDAQRGMAAGVCQTVLEDMAGQIGLAIEKRGPGLPIVRADGSVLWHSTQDVADNLDKAVLGGFVEIATLFREVLDALDHLDPKDHVLIGLAGESDFQLIRIPMENPAERVREVLDKWGR